MYISPLAFDSVLSCWYVVSMRYCKMIRRIAVFATSSALLLALAAVPAHAGAESPHTASKAVSHTSPITVAPAPSPDLTMVASIICLPVPGGSVCCNTEPGKSNSCGLDLRPQHGAPKPETASLWRSATLAHTSPYRRMSGRMYANAAMISRLSGAHYDPGNAMRAAPSARA
jgi:hypothetical protein